MTKLSGYLEDAFGMAIPNCTIELKAQKTTLSVITKTSAFSSPNGEGFYEMNVKPGQYSVILLMDGYSPKQVGEITIYLDSPDGTLNDFLLVPNSNEIKPELITALEQVRYENQQIVEKAKQEVQLLTQNMQHIAEQTKEEINQSTQQALDAKNLAEQAKIDAQNLLSNVVKKSGDEISGNLKINGSLTSENLVDVATNIGRTGAIPLKVVSSDIDIYNLPAGYRGMCDLVNYKTAKLPRWMYIHKIVNRDSGSKGTIAIAYNYHNGATFVGCTNGEGENSKIGWKEYITSTGGTLTGQLTSTHENPIRFKSKDRSMIFRWIGNVFTLLFTNKGDPDGSWNALRPLEINPDNGMVKLGHGVSIHGDATKNGIKIPVVTEVANQLIGAATGGGIRYAKIAIGHITVLERGNVSFLASGANNYGSTNNNLEYVSFSSRTNSNKATIIHQIITPVSHPNHQNIYGWVHNPANNTVELWIKSPGYASDFGLTRLSGYDSSRMSICDQIVWQSAEPQNIVYTEPSNVLMKGDYGFGASQYYIQDMNDADKTMPTQIAYAQGGATSGTPLGNDTALIHFRGNINRAWQIALDSWGSGHLCYRVRNNAPFSNWITVMTNRNTTTDANGFLKKASPIVRLINPHDKIAQETCKEDAFYCSGEGYVNDEAKEVEIKYLGVGHYEVHGSLGFAKKGWYIETPEDANGNKKLFVEYSTDSENIITVQTYKKSFENGEFIAGEPMDIPEGRWIDLRLDMPVVASLNDKIPEEVEFN